MMQIFTKTNFTDLETLAAIERAIRISNPNQLVVRGVKLSTVGTIGKYYREFDTTQKTSGLKPEELKYDVYLTRR